MSFGKLTLGDFGELRVLEEVVLPIAREFDGLTRAGDDCTLVESMASTIAVTADVGPKPLLSNIHGYEGDLEAAGWLAAVVNASDLATVGARPLCMTNCIDAPIDLLLDELVCYVRGYYRAVSEFGFRNGGGDLRQGAKLEMRVFAVGSCEEASHIGRRGVRGDDRLIVVGPTGEFMATYLLAASEATKQNNVRRKRLSTTMEEILRFPRPRLREMRTLVEEGVIVAASDTSDGLIGAVDNLARASGCSFDLELYEARLPAVVKDAAQRTGFNPWNIFCAWGDWSVVIAVRPCFMKKVRLLCRVHNIQNVEIGRARNDSKGLRARLDGGATFDMRPLRNENFCIKGFNQGLDAHLQYLLTTELFARRKEVGGRREWV